MKKVVCEKLTENFSTGNHTHYYKAACAVLVPGGPGLHHAIYSKDLSTSVSRICDQNGFITSLCMIFSKCKDY